jgi:hypothetical protein
VIVLYILNQLLTDVRLSKFILSEFTLSSQSKGRKAILDSFAITSNVKKRLKSAENVPKK